MTVAAPPAISRARWIVAGAGAVLLLAGLIVGLLPHTVANPYTGLGTVACGSYFGAGPEPSQLDAAAFTDGTTGTIPGGGVGRAVTACDSARHGVGPVTDLLLLAGGAAVLFTVGGPLWQRMSGPPEAQPDDATA